METITIIAILAFAILNLILFFKIWGMTNDVSRIADYVQRIANRTNADSKPKTTIGQEATTSTANPMPSKEEETTSTTKPAPVKEEDEVSAGKVAVIVFVVVIFLLIVFAYAQNY